MAILHSCQTYQCDAAGCEKVLSVHDRESLEAFENTWADTTLHHYCPTCRHLPDVGRQLAEDKEFWLKAGMVGVPKEEYAN